MHWLNDYTKLINCSCLETICGNLNLVITKLLNTFDISNFLTLTCSSFLLYQVLGSDCCCIFIEECFIAICSCKCKIILAILICDFINDSILILAIYRIVLIFCVKHCEELISVCNAVIICIIFPCSLSPLILRCKKRNHQLIFHSCSNFIWHICKCIRNIFICDGICCCGIQTVIFHTFDIGGIECCISIIICIRKYIICENQVICGKRLTVRKCYTLTKLEIVYSLILALCNSYVGKSCISIIRSVILMCLTLDTIVNNSTCTVTSKQILTYILCDLLIRNCLVE